MKHLSLVFILFVVCFSCHWPGHQYRGQEKIIADSVLNLGCSNDITDSLQKISLRNNCTKYIYYYIDGKVETILENDENGRNKRTICFYQNGKKKHEEVYDYKKRTVMIYGWDVYGKEYRKKEGFVNFTY